MCSKFKASFGGSCGVESQARGSMCFPMGHGEPPKVLEQARSMSSCVSAMLNSDARAVLGSKGPVVIALVSLGAHDTNLWPRRGQRAARCPREA